MINEIKSQVKISSLINKWTPLRKKGGLFWGLCPFHGEKTPSFAVNDEKQIFHCFGCGLSGDIFKFLQIKEEKTFGQVVEELANELGIKKKTRFLSSGVENVLQKALEFYESKLCSEKELIFVQRGISNEMIKKFQLGFSPDNHLLDYLYQFFSHSLITEAGLVNPSGFDPFRNRLIIPIKNRQNNPIGFSGRIVDETTKAPKYINSAETVLFQKNLHLFGEQFMSTMNDPVILVEGYMDVIQMHQNGFTSTLGIMGTSLNRGHFITLFQKFSHVIIMFDGDSAGKRALENSLHIFLKSVTPHKKISVVELEEKDPDELLIKYGKKKMESYINNSIPLEFWVEKRIIADYYSYGNKAILLEKISDLSKMINNEFIREAWKNQWKSYKSCVVQSLKIKPEYSEEKLLSIIVNSLDLVEEIAENVHDISFKSQKFNQIFQYIIDNLFHQSNSEILKYINENMGFRPKKTPLFVGSKALLIYLQDYYKKINV